MHPRRSLGHILSSLVAVGWLATASPAQTCNPQVSLAGNPCVCATVDFTMTNNCGCPSLLVLSLDPNPYTIPGVVTLPGGPPFFALAFSPTTCSPVTVPFTIPCRNKLIGVPLVAFNLSVDSSGVVASPPVNMTICGGDIGDRVWCDQNNDGIQDPGEPGLEGVTVRLDCSPTGPLLSTTTGINGSYLFDNLPLVPCTVSVDPSTALLQRKVPGISCPVDLMVDLSSLITYLDADFCFVDCNPCDGGVTDLRLRYTGATTANIIVLDKDDNQVFDGSVAPNGTFVFAGVRQDGTFGNEIKVFVDGVETRIHTSCSQEIGPGSVFGDLAVVAGESRNGGPLCARSPCEDGKPCSLTLRYTGESCAATQHGQDPGKVSCAGDPNFASSVFILATDNDDPNNSGANVWFSGTVALDETFTLLSFNEGENKLNSETFVHAFDGAGNLLQSVEFHTSCSQPLIFGDQFGAFRLEGYSAEGTCPDPNECSAGDPCALTMRYTGESCAATVHNQDPSKVSCTGDPAFATPVRIRASDKSDPNDTGANVWFDGQVSLGATFDLLAANANENKLKSVTWIHIIDSAGNVLQTVEFHTSCSQPLVLGNQFGSVVLEGFTPEGSCSTGSGNQDLCSGGRPQTITMTYTGQDCAASSNAQDPSKWDCSGDPGMAPAVTIVVTDDADPMATNANVWFTGVVNLNSSFTLSALNEPGQTRLDTNTYAYIYDGTNLLQSIRLHTSCSQPLRVDDQWGSLRLVGLTLD